MKKITKIMASVLSAAVMATCSLSASALGPYDILDVDRDSLKLVISSETSTGGSNELWVDSDYRYIVANLWKTTVAVRMTDGTEPPKPADSDRIYVDKLSNVQKLNFLCVDSAWFMNADNVKISDDLYVVKGFENADEAEKYCQELLSEGKADYAEPIVTGKYSYCYPAGTLLRYFNGSEINYDESKLDEINAFSGESFILEISGSDETATLDYLKENVDGFMESVSAATENGSNVYFQFKDDTDNETKVNVLKQMSNLENFSKPFIPTYSILVDGPGTTAINAMPKKYKAGDVNMDEKVNIYDAIDVAKFAMNTKTFNDNETVLADMDCNGKIDLYDAIEIAKILM